MPHVVVFSSLFPSAEQPGAGLFVRERMFRVGQELPLCVVSPTPWFPFQSLIRRFRPGFRPAVTRYERQGEFDVWHPRFLSVPGRLKSLDGLSMALGALPRLQRLKRAGRVDIIDAHFAYPDGYAAALLGRWLGVPVTITLRGAEVRQARDPVLARMLARALHRAQRIFSVSQSLRQAACGLGIAAERIRVVENGVDLAKFTAVPRAEARRKLGLPAESPVLITVGGLVERKGFHRVIECLPALRLAHPDLMYLVVGGPSPEGDIGDKLRRQAQELGLAGAVRFLGPMPPEEVHVPLSAADIFVLATRNEGWANVILEAMACGLPVIATDVGGNREVVCDPNLGKIVPFGDSGQLRDAISESLQMPWDRDAIRRYAEGHTWDRRIGALVDEFRTLHADRNVRRASEEALDGG